MPTIQMNNGHFEDLGRLLSKKKVKLKIRRSVFVYKFENGELASAKRL